MLSRYRKLLGEQAYAALENTRSSSRSSPKMSAELRSARLAAQQPPPPSLFALLPVELVLTIAKHALALHLPTCLSLRQSCKELREVVDAPQAGGGRSVRAEAEARRLRWEEAVHNEISANGQVLTTVVDPDSNSLRPWAYGPLLPVTGNSSWAIKVEPTYAIVGVCDAAGLNSWGLRLFHGCLFREYRDANGEEVLPLPPPPDGWPDGPRLLQVVKDEAGNPGHGATGAVIEVLIDHDNGVLSYRVNGGPVLEALKGFPKGAAGRLRPWASTTCFFRHHASFARPYF